MKHRTSFTAWLLSLGALLIFLGLGYWVFILRTFYWDSDVFRFLLDHWTQPWFRHALAQWTWLGNRETMTLLLVIMTGTLMTLSRLRLAALCLIVELLLAAGAEAVLKLWFAALEHPPIDPTLPTVIHSYPSGHAMLAIGFYGLIIYMLAKRFPQKQVLFYIGGSILVLFLGLSRLTLKCHLLSDIIGGYAVGIPLLLTGIWLYNTLPQRFPWLRPTWQTVGIRPPQSR